MPTTTTTYSFNKPVVGADEDDWGGYLNGNWDSVDDLLDGTTPVTGIDINSGTLDGVTIGGTTAGAGTFTTLTANTSITGTLATAAQANVTSLGTLTGLTIGGNLSVDGGTIKLDGNYPVGTNNVALGDAALDDGSLSGGYNTAIGASALTANTTANSNTGVGYAALGANTLGADNTAVGAAALDANTSGGSNAALGQGSLSSNTTGSNNTAIGRLALESNTTASNNTAVGYYALQSNTAANNVAVGYGSAYQNTTGTANTAIGYYALQSNTTASYNTAVGYQAGYSNTSGQFNTSTGSLALTTNTTGQYNSAFGMQALRYNTNGSYNTAVGQNAMQSNTTASYNTAVGYQALYSYVSGSGENVAIGANALYSQTTGYENIGIGRGAGNDITTGIRNTLIGDDAGYLITTGTRNTIIGRYNGNQNGLDIRTSSNNIVLSDGDGNPRVYVNSSGYIMNSNAISGMDLGFGQQHFSVKTTDGSSAAIFGNTSTSTSTTLTYASNTSYVGHLMDNRVGRTQNSGFNFVIYRSGGNADTEFYLRGDGQAYADGSWNGGGADYAEYFEWADGNPDNEDRRGYSVILENSKMRKATADDDAALIFGVISARPSMIGDADIGAWKSKYLKDDFGAYQRDENDERILNPDYDPDQEYTSREDRPEWDTVGLMGKLRIRKGQPTGSNWIKMRDVSDTVEEWLVR